MCVQSYIKENWFQNLEIFRNIPQKCFCNTDTTYGLCTASKPYNGTVISFDPANAGMQCGSYVDGHPRFYDTDGSFVAGTHAHLLCDTTAACQSKMAATLQRLMTFNGQVGIWVALYLLAMAIAGYEVRSKYLWLEHADLTGKSESLLLSDGTPRGKSSSGFSDDHLSGFL